MWEAEFVRYVVTGAAGFIGSHLAEALLAAGHEVVGIDSFTSFYDPAIKEDNAAGLEVRRIDLAEDLLDFSEFDGVFHLAGRGGARSFGAAAVAYGHDNVQASRRVFEAAAHAGARVVFASSSSVYGAAERHPTTEETAPAPLSPYGVSKVACEQTALACAESLQLEVVILRYFSVFGPRQRPDMAFMRIAQALMGNCPFELYGDGFQTRSWTYVDDVVAATTLAMGSGFGTYNVGGPVEASLNDAIAVLESLAGRALDVRRLPALEEPRRTSADTSRIRRQLGWRPQTSLEQGLRAQWNWTAERAAHAEWASAGT